MTAKTVIVIRETALKSLLRDSTTLALFISLIGIGVILESSAMQWVGAIIAFIATIGRSSGLRKDLTIAQAREYLDELEREIR